MQLIVPTQEESHKLLIEELLLTLINFKADSKWSSTSYSNVFADMTNLRVLIAPSKSNCVSKEGSFTKGQNVLINCTQAFSSIPTGYVNSVTAFDHTDYLLGFSFKIPLSMSSNKNDL